MKYLFAKQFTVIFLISIFWINISLFSQQSAYVIADINASSSTPIQAYALQDSIVVFQAEYGVPNWGNGAVGLGLAPDPDSSFLFVTYENSQVIQLLNATTMSNEGTTTAPGASNLSGIVYDGNNSHVYTVDRGTSNLYSYIWNAGYKTLVLDSEVTLPNATAWGIFLDDENELLYVANSSSITYYNTNDWSLEGTINNLANNGAINVEKDIDQNLLYYGGAFASNYYLTKYDLNTNEQTYVSLENSSGVMGMTLNQQTGLLYITTGQSGDKIKVFDSNLNMLYETYGIGNPTDIVTGNVGYNPLNFIIDSDINCIEPGENAEYSLCYENTYANIATNVVIVATIPYNTDYVSSSNGGSYNSTTDEVTWNIGNVPAGTTQECVSLEISISPNFPIPSTLLFEAGLNADNIGTVGIGVVIVTDTIMISPIPNPVIAGLDSVCAFDQGLNYVTQSYQGHSYSWEIENGNILSGEDTNNVVVDWLSGNDASIAVNETIIASGCSSLKILPVTIHPKPLIDFITNDTALCPLSDTLMLFPAEPGENYTLEWTCSDISSPWHEYTGDTVYIYTTGVGFYFATYHLNIINDKGCWDEESVYVVFDFSECEPYINELDSPGVISIFPNPANDVLNIEISTSEIQLPLNIVINDESGKTVFSKEIDQIIGDVYTEELNISDLSNGVYFLNISGQNIFGVKKIIKN